jgi:hypothetical protein
MARARKALNRQQLISFGLDACATQLGQATSAPSSGDRVARHEEPHELKVVTDDREKDAIRKAICEDAANLALMVNNAK